MEVNTELMYSLAGSRFMEAACSADTVSLYSIQECYWAGKSRFCDIVIAQSPVFGKVLFLDKEIQSAESDEAIYHEHLVHPVLNATAHIVGKRVLIVGGGEGATAREVLKWSPNSVAQVDWVDIDGALVDLCRRHLSWADDDVYNDRRLTYVAADIRQFLAATTTHYDVIILDLPDPDVDALKALSVAEDPVEYPLYGRKFFQVLREHMVLREDMGPQSVLVSHTGPVAPGGDEEERRAGLAWIHAMATENGFGAGHAYKTFIPSFQSEWGFWMSCAPCTESRFPNGLAVMDICAQAAAFTWPRYYTSPYFGFTNTSTSATS
jgi:spermidine synthase